MSSPDESGVVTISRGRDESPSVIIGSLVVLTVDVLVIAGLVIYTMLSRRRYGKFIEQMDLADISVPVQFFILTPGPIYTAGFLLAVVALILKECALDNKSLALRINLLALAVAVCLLITFYWMVQLRFDAIL